MGLLFGRTLGYDSAPEINRFSLQGVTDQMLKIRLRRGGATHAPFYRIVVSDSLKTPSAATVEQIGHYDPKKNPADVKIDRTRVDYWVSKGAQLSPTVKSLLKKYKA
jgi:small subunit ribosomal protein S16